MAFHRTPEIEHTLELLESGRNVFLTGKAGTGKSTLIRYFINSADGNVMVAAPTGIAALNVGGYTLHRLFGFPPGVTPQKIRSSSYAPRRFKREIKNLDTLIIDEISMVRADIFDCVELALRRFGPQPGQAFGGVQMVLVGDLYQLPPVVKPAEREYFSTTYATPFFFSGQEFNLANFETVQLEKIFRQEDSDDLVDILNAIREGNMTQELADRLNSRCQPVTENTGNFSVTLAPTNRVADRINQRELALIDARENIAQAVETGDLAGFDPPTPAELKFKVGAQVMMLNNDSEGAWVNGSVGQVLSVEEDAEDGPVVMVELADGEVVPVTEHTWEVTRPVVKDDVLEHEVIGSFTQFPFKLAWAVTIHKSQGQTLERAVIDLTGGMFAPGQLYVALSRCRTLDGLTLTRPVRPRDVMVDNRIRQFLHHREMGDGTLFGPLPRTRPASSSQ